MKTKKWAKALSLVLAFAMIFVLALPTARADNTKTNTVTLHKLMLTKAQFDAWDSVNMEKGAHLKDNGAGPKQVVNAKGDLIYKHGTDPDATFDTKSEGGVLATEADFNTYKLDTLLYDASIAMVLDQMKKIAALQGVEDSTKNPIKEVAGVYFAWQDADHLTVTDADIAPGGIFSGLSPLPKVGDPVYIKGNDTDKTKPADLVGGKLQYTTDLSSAMGGKTSTSGIKFTTTGLIQSPSHKYKIAEISELTTYKTPEGKIIVEQKAVPVEITLPLVNNNGVVAEAHVYPKNRDDKPNADKNFQKDDKTHKKTQVGNNDTFNQGAQINNSGKEKGTATAKVGDEIPYETITTISKGTVLGKLVLTDAMDSALTYQKPLTIEVGYLEKPVDPATEQTFKKVDAFALHDKTWNDGTNDHPADYTLQTDDRGYTLTFTKAGLERLAGFKIPAGITNAVADTIAIRLAYKAKVNSNAVPDQAIDNHFTVDYGHTPGKEVEEKPVTPQNGQLPVVKNWTKDGKATDSNGNNIQPKAGTTVVYTLKIKKGTETKEFSVTLNGNEYNGVPLPHFYLGKIFKGTGTPTAEDQNNPDKWAEINFEAGATAYAGTFTGLPQDPAFSYSITERVGGYDVTITPDNANGSVTLTNDENPNNPPPIVPTDPHVVTGGRRFVKTNMGEGKDLKRLSLAKFYVTREITKQAGDAAPTKVTQYLTKKTADEVKLANKLYEDAEAKYLKAIDDYNKALKAANGNHDTVTMTLDGETLTGDANIFPKIDKLKTERDKRYQIAQDAYDWKDMPPKGDPTDAWIFTSNNNGQIEITGLAYGTYNLVELTPPEGYAKIEPKEFVVSSGSYHGGGSTEILYDPNGGGKDPTGLRIPNREVTIPQTGGIGTVIFTVVGSGLVAGAFIILRKNREDQYA